MRDFLTGAAIILIVLLTAALAGPYFIDWNGQRGFLEARLSQALGQTVTIGGAIDLKLLPTPYLILNQTVIGEDDGPIKTGIRHLDLELSIAPLLHGEFDITEARLEEPTVRVTLQRDRTLPTLPKAPVLRADVRFERIVMVDGTLAVADPMSGHTFVADHLDMTAEAPSLAGPFKGSGAAGGAATRTKFRFNTTEAKSGRTRAHVIVEETPSHPGLDLDGTVALTASGQDVVRQTFDGTITLDGHVGQAGAVPLAWKLSGALKADPQRARLDGGEVRIGSEAASLALQATAVGDFGATPSLHLDLAAKQIDIDRLSGAPIDAKIPPPPPLPTLAQVRSALAALTPPIASSLDVAIDAATYGGEPIETLRAHMGSGPHPPLQISGEGPGGSHLALDGTLTPSGFDGTADLGADNVPRALAWLATIDPAITLKPTDLPFKAVRLAGKIDSDGASIASHDFALTLDRSTLTGSARLAFDATPMKITAILSAKTLDLDALPSLATIDGTIGAVDLDVTLDANAVKIGRLGNGALDTGQLGLALTRSGGRVILKRLAADNLDGARVEASGTLDTDKATLTVKLDATRLEAAAALMRRLVPGDATDVLVARAGSLAPTTLAVDIALAKTSGVFKPIGLTVSGRLAATTIDAKLTPKSPDTIDLTASLDAPEGSALLRQLGLPALPLDTIGKSRLALQAHGASGKPLETNLQAVFGATTVDISGVFDLLGTGRTRFAGAGSAHLRSPDMGPLAQSLAIAFPDMTGRLPVSGTAALAVGQAGIALSDIVGVVADTKVKGALRWNDVPPASVQGTLDVDRMAFGTLVGLALGPVPLGSTGTPWSTNPFTAGLIDPPRVDIALTAKALDLADGLVAKDAALDLGIARNLVTMTHLTANLRGGRIGADLSLRRDGRQAALEGKIVADGVTVDLPAATTVLTGSLDLAGSGSSAAALVASLAGSGNATAADLAIPGADAKALPRIFGEVEADTLAVDAESIVRAFDETGSSPLSIGDQAFDLGLAAGLLRFDGGTTPDGQGAPVTSTVSATMDLRRMILDVRAEETLQALPKDWSGPPPSIVVTQAGGLTTPKRGFDVAGLINAVAARAIARESARIEAYEFDIRERAFFNQRLQSERRREQDRLKAEDDARKTEADRKAKIEATRLEIIRKDEAARRAKAENEEATRNAEREKALLDRLDRDRRDATRRETSPQTDPRRFDTAPGAPAGDPSAAGRY